MAIVRYKGKMRTTCVGGMYSEMCGPIDWRITIQIYRASTLHDWLFRCTNYKSDDDSIKFHELSLCDTKDIYKTTTETTTCTVHIHVINLWICLCSVRLSIPQLKPEYQSFCYSYLYDRNLNMKPKLIFCSIN